MIAARVFLCGGPKVGVVIEHIKRIPCRIATRGQGYPLQPLAKWLQGVRTLRCKFTVFCAKRTQVSAGGTLHHRRPIAGGYDTVGSNIRHPLAARRI